MVSSVLYGLLGLASGSAAWKLGVGYDANSYHYINYTTVPGVFVQDDPSTNPSGFDYAAVDFGLINRTYPTDKDLGCKSKGLSQWQRFAHYVDTLNQGAGPDVAYKVLFMGRHGEGYHNAAETFYGTPAWNCYWAQLDGNSTVTWDDAMLTDEGVREAEKANAFWRSLLAHQGAPAPESYYTSPLRRCLYTANITFGGLDLPRGRPFRPTIKEFLREGISTHTCDRRSSREAIAGLFPGWPIEPGFSDADPYWLGTAGEVSSAQQARSLRALDEVFVGDDATWVSVTSHSGEIGSLLAVLGHRAFSLSTGQVIPALVRAERLYHAYPSRTVDAWTALAACTAPPVTSVAGVGCVCSGDATATTAAPTSTAA